MPKAIPIRRLTWLSWWFHLAASLTLAVFLVVMPMGHIIIALPWAVVVILAVYSARNSGFAGETLVIHVVAGAIIVAAAIAAPVKTTEKVLDRLVELPATTLTLAEMDREHNFDQTDPWLPRQVWISPPPEAAETPIHFPAKTITLREFVGAIEQQSNLRHRFSHCGNGSSILYGGDCSFGLHLRANPY
jgi:hypothetical protein